MIKKLCVGAVALAFAGLTQAGVYRITFTADAFADVAGSQPSSVSALSGSFEWNSASQLDPIDSIVDVQLSIGGHVYTLAELAFQNGGETTSTFGGAAGGGSNFITAGTNDFAFTFDRTGQFYNFFYTLPGATTSWISRQGSVSVSSAPLPEPPTVLLLLSAGVVGGLLRRRRAVR